MTIVPLHVPGADPQRLLRDWMPGAWIGAVKLAFDAVTELSSGPQGDVVENHPPHWLVALWPPQSLQQPFLRRWPQKVLLQPAEQEPQAVLTLLRELSERERLWVLNEDLDWALLAEIVLQVEALQGYQRGELQRFVESERAAMRGRIAWAYGARPRASLGRW